MMAAVETFNAIEVVALCSKRVRQRRRWFGRWPVLAQDARKQKRPANFHSPADKLSGAKNE
jgi:hypothetical protein